MTNLTKEEYARLHLKAKRGMLTAEASAAGMPSGIRSGKS